MRFFVVSILPELFPSITQHGLLGRAVNTGKVQLDFINPRDFTTDKHRTVDDTPYGGGSGMVMKPEPLVAAMEEAERKSMAEESGRPLRIFLCPTGKPFRQEMARELSKENSITLVCGRYEGIDERAREEVDLEISLGDFVLMGGEVAAVVLLEAISRLLPGVLGNPESSVDESHSAHLLEYPQYTRPLEFRGKVVPDVLLSGHHADVAKWRKEQAILRTLDRRPELLSGIELSKKERKWFDEIKAQRASKEASGGES